MSAGRACHLRLGSELSWRVSFVAAFGLASALRSASDKLRSLSLFLNLTREHFASIPSIVSSANCVFALKRVNYLSVFRTYSSMPSRTYPSTPSSSKWWQPPIPRNADGDIVIVQEVNNVYAACVYKKIRHEWPYYRQVVAQNQCQHLYACCDSSIDNCQHLLTPGGGLCHCQRWKQLWDQDVFENYKVGRYTDSRSFVRRLMEIDDRYGILGIGLRRNGLGQLNAWLIRYYGIPTKS